jgi:hypothetical protein
MERFRSAVERAVAFHSDDSVGDNEIRADRGTDVENTFVNAGPVEDVFRPAVTRPRNDSEHVLHAERDAGPVMGFHFGHRNDEVGCQDRSWKPQTVQTGIVGPKRGFDEFVAIEIHKCDLAVHKLIAEPGLVSPTANRGSIKISGRIPYTGFPTPRRMASGSAVQLLRSLIVINDRL